MKFQFQRLMDKIHNKFHVVAVTAGFYGPENKRCYFIITARDGMWGLNIIPIESCNRVLRALWVASEALSTALMPLFMQYYHSRYKVDSVPSSLDGMRALRVGKVEVMHYVDTPFAKEVIPIIVDLISQDPGAAEEILDRIERIESEKAGKADKEQDDEGGNDDVRENL